MCSFRELKRFIFRLARSAKALFCFFLSPFPLVFCAFAESPRNAKKSKMMNTETKKRFAQNFRFLFRRKTQIYLRLTVEEKVVFEKTSKS